MSSHTKAYRVEGRASHAPPSAIARPPKGCLPRGGAFDQPGAGTLRASQSPRTAAIRRRCQPGDRTSSAQPSFRSAAAAWRSTVTLAVDCNPARVRVEIGDRSPGCPRLRDADATAEGGRGLLLVDALAADWGVRATPTGKIVWFEIASQP